MDFIPPDERSEAPSSPTCVDGEERKACTELDPSGFFIRHPPKPHMLNKFITPDDQLFQTIHMGAAVIDLDKYQITIDGLVARPFSLTLDQLSPLKPPNENVWRIGNVRWTGVPLKAILTIAKPLPEAQCVWSDGLDFGHFGGVDSDRYQKDLPLQKALSSETVLAYEMNGEPLSRKRGGPVRLLVPGWFGTNSTKWLCRLSLQSRRAKGHFTTTFYNERDPMNSNNGMRPVWVVEPNSMIVVPAHDSRLQSTLVEIAGWAWSCEGISHVSVSLDGGETWTETVLGPRIDFSWQGFKTALIVQPGLHSITARASSTNGLQQPLKGRRNHVHIIQFEVL